MSGSTNLTYTAPVDFRIQPAVPDEVPEQYRAAFTQLYSAIQQIISTFVNNCGIGARNTNQWNDLAGTSLTLLAGNLNRFYVVAGEAIPYGSAVALITNGAGGIKAMLANATNNTLPCTAFCTTSTGILNGDTGEVQIVAGVVRILGMTAGTKYFLSTTSGLIAATPAVVAGNIEQYIGIAITSETLAFNTGYWIQH